MGYITTTTPIGLDLDHNEFRAIQFNTLNTRDPIAVATIPRQGRRGATPSQDELKQLFNTLCQRGFVGTTVALAVPKEHSSFHILDLPPEGSGAPINRLALLETQRSGAHKTEQLEIGYWTQPPKTPPSKFPSPYYTVACETQPLDELLDQFESTNFQPTSIEPIETALTRAATAHPEFVQDSIHSIIEIGWEHSWAIITLGHTPVYTRKIGYGAEHIYRQLIDDHAIPASVINTIFSPNNPIESSETQIARIVHTLMTPMLAQIVDQLDTALTYVSQQHRFAPFGIILRSGYFANLDQTARAISQRTGMPTIQLAAARADHEGFASPVSKFEFDKSPRLNIAAGLALGAAS